MRQRATSESWSRMWSSYKKRCNSSKQRRSRPRLVSCSRMRSSSRKSTNCVENSTKHRSRPTPIVKSMRHFLIVMKRTEMRLYVFAAWFVPRNGRHAWAVSSCLNCSEVLLYFSIKERTASLQIRRITSSVNTFIYYWKLYSVTLTTNLLSPCQNSVVHIMPKVLLDLYKSSWYIIPESLW